MSDYKLIKTETLNELCEATRTAESSDEAIRVSDIPSKVTEVGRKLQKKIEFNKKLFEGTLTKIEEEDLEGIEVLNEYSIENQPNLTSIEIPKTVQLIGPEFINECHNVAYLKIPFIGSDRESPSSLGTIVPEHSEDLVIELTDAEGLNVSTFEEEQIKKVIINEGVTTIPEDCFASSTVQEVELPNSLKTIESRAFKNCLQLKTISLPENCTTLHPQAFENSVLEEIVIPSKLSSWGSSVFRQCSNLTKVTFKGMLPKIIAGTFSNSALKQIDWPTGLKEIQQSSFNNTKLEKLNFPATVNIIGKMAFANCANLKELELHEDIQTISTDSFSGTSVEKLTCPGRFLDCVPLKQVKIARITSATNDGSFVSDFKYNINLTSVELPEGTQSIPNQFFLGCANLSTIILPSTLNKINKNSFYGCVSLTVLTIPDSVSSVSDDAFEATEIQTLITPAKEWVKHIPKSNLQKIITTSGSTLHEGSFNEAPELTEVELHEGIVNFQHEVFRNCSKLKELSIPSTVETMENDVFKGCSSLSDIYVLNKNKGEIAGAPWGIEGTVRIHWKDETELLEIKFYFEENNGKTHTYDMEPDQTWKDWVQSSYNIDGFYITDTSVCAPETFDTNTYVVLKNGGYQLLNDKIIKQGTYSTSSGG